MPDFYLIGGPNGAGKTTIALQVLPSLGYMEYVNADALASALSPFQPETVAFQAGVLMMKRLHQLRDKGVSFASESTLSARAYAPFIRKCRESGYKIHLLYVWLPSDDMAVERVAHRVLAGGHDIPKDVIRRRYEAGLKNFNELYLPLADTFRVYDNSSLPTVVVAEGSIDSPLIFQPQTWQRITNPQTGDDHS